MSVAPPNYEFLSRLARILNAGQSRSVLLAGNVHDLFFSEASSEYVPLLPCLGHRYRVDGVARITYELNGPIRFLDDREKQLVRNAWIRFRTGRDLDQLILKGLTDPKAVQQREMLERQFDEQLLSAIGKPTVALELLRQLTLCSRAQTGAMPFGLMIFIEAADLLLPAGDGDISRLSGADRQRISIVQDWFCDPGFLDGRDSVIMLADSRGGVHPRVAALPQVLDVEVPAPDAATRLHYIDWFSQRARAAPSLAMPPEELAATTAGLSIHALRQLLTGAAHTGQLVTPSDVVDRVEAYITAQLGEGVVEFKRPTHTLADVVGYRALKRFIADELMPRMRLTAEGSLPGAAVAGPIGAGKTFIFEAMAGELGLPVLVLKNIRSPYFGQTDVIFERLRRVLESLGKVVVFVDEADTQFGGVGADAHETERRLTGKVQQMMSDPKLRGRVVWLLMTARIERLSPDLRRPGRVGDLIIPVLDPSSAPGNDDRRDFVVWVLQAVMDDVGDVAVDRLEALTRDYSAAAFAALRSQLKARAAITQEPLWLDDVEAVVRDHLPADIGAARRYQTLQALVNCTRRSLLPDPRVDDATREAWRRELQQLDATLAR